MKVWSEGTSLEIETEQGKDWISYYQIRSNNFVKLHIIWALVILVLGLSVTLKPYFIR